MNIVAHLNQWQQSSQNRSHKYLRGVIPITNHRNGERTCEASFLWALICMWMVFLCLDNVTMAPKKSALQLKKKKGCHKFYTWRDILVMEIARKFTIIESMNWRRLLMDNLPRSSTSSEGITDRDDQHISAWLPAIIASLLPRELPIVFAKASGLSLSAGDWQLQALWQGFQAQSLP